MTHNLMDTFVPFSSRYKTTLLENSLRIMNIILSARYSVFNQVKSVSFYKVVPIDKYMNQSEKIEVKLLDY